MLGSTHHSVFKLCNCTLACVCMFELAIIYDFEQHEIDGDAGTHLSNV